MRSLLQKYLPLLEKASVQTSDEFSHVYVLLHIDR